MSTLILGIESSCDETSAAVVSDGRRVMSNVISSQIDIHKAYGGVVPEIASRKHVEAVIPVIDEAIRKAEVSPVDIDAIAVTSGPGLIGALLVGVTAAKTLADAWDKPLVPIHHIEGHISANFIEYEELEPPFVCLVASGGHSHIILCSDYGVYKILGRTRDDAAGEAFDKISRALGLGYPGGPQIDRTAQLYVPVQGSNELHFPTSHFQGSLDFSFSGVKTAVLNYLNNAKARGEDICVPEVCDAFQRAVVDILAVNTITAAQQVGCNAVALAGGVAANSALRKRMQELAEKHQMIFYRPRPILCTDNAAMIASAAYYALRNGRTAGADLNARANWDIESL